MAALVIVAVLVGSCGGDDDEASGDTGAATVTVRPTTTTSITTTTTPPQGAIPEELRGRWRTTAANGDQLTLTVYEASYQIRRGPGAAGGALRVDGDTMTFSTTVCDGVGTYRWARDGDTLTLTVVGEDPCPGRADVLAAGLVFTADR